MIFTAKKKQKASSKKWNKAHEFHRKKSTKREMGHPVYVYGKRKNTFKYLVFTHTPEEGRENLYERLKHNIDPDEKDRATYVRKTFGVSNKDAFRSPDKKYRIHDQDKDTVNKYKK